MTNKTRTTVRLASAVVLALMGIAVLHCSNLLYAFRMHGGYTAPETEFGVGMQALGIMVLEWGVGIVGAAMLILGAIGIYNQIKKKMR